MSDDNNNNPPGGVPGGPGTPGGKNFDSGFITGEFKHQQLSARVPESQTRGVFSTGVIVLTSQSEFILDFLLRMARPHQVVARVVLPPSVMPSAIAVLRDNIQKFTDRFGPIPELPKPENERRPTLQEVYDDLKLPDESLSGSYANALMVGHTPAEFYIDFITNFFPKSAVSARVYLSAAHMPRLVDSLSQTFNDYQRRILAARQQQPPPPPPATSEPDPQPPPG